MHTVHGNRAVNDILEHFRFDVRAVLPMWECRHA